MARLGRVYDRNRKADKENNPLSAAKGYSASPDDIYVVPGFNIRTLDQEHVDALAKAYMAGQYVPPILVAVGEGGRLELVDGHHRLQAAKIANVKRLQLSEFEGSEQERIAEAIRSSQGRSLSATERARAYQRLRANGWSDKEIADSVARSEGDVANHLLLADCGEEVLTMIDNNIVKPTPVQQLARSHGAENVARALREALSKKEAREIVEAGEGRAKAVRKGKKPSTSGTKKRNTGTKLKAEDLSLAGFTSEDAMKVADYATYIDTKGVTAMDLYKLGDASAWEPVEVTIPVNKLLLMLSTLEKYKPRIPYDKRKPSGEPKED